MKIKLAAAYTGAAVLGLILAAALLLVMLQWGNHCDFSLYGKSLVLNTAAVLLLSMVVGFVVPALIKLEWRWMSVIHRHRKDIKAMEAAVARATPGPAPAAPAAPSVPPSE
jgi:hypothetical protein